MLPSTVYSNAGSPVHTRPGYTNSSPWPGHSKQEEEAARKAIFDHAVRYLYSQINKTLAIYFEYSRLITIHSI